MKALWTFLAPESSLVVVRIQCFHCQGLSSIPGQGIKILQAVWRWGEKNYLCQIPWDCTYKMIPENVEWGTHPPWQAFEDSPSNQEWMPLRFLVGFQKSELMIMKGPWHWPWVVTWLSVISALCMLSHFSHIWLFVTPWSVVHQAPLSMKFSRQEYWSGLLCLSARDFPNPGIEPTSLLRLLHCRWFFTH